MWAATRQQAALSTPAQRLADGHSQRRRASAGCLGTAATVLVTANFVHGTLTDCGAVSNHQWCMLLSAAATLVALAPVIVYLFKTAKRDVPVLVHMAGLYFVFSLMAFSSFVYLLSTLYCHPSGASLFFGCTAVGFEHFSFIVLAYMQVVKVRALESTSDMPSSSQGRLELIWRGVVIALVLKTVSVPFTWPAPWGVLLGKDLMPVFEDLMNGKMSSDWEIHIAAFWLVSLGVGTVLYYTFLTALTCVAVKSMFKARKRLKGNDIASVYLRQMLTKNAWLTMLANTVSLTRGHLTMTCYTNAGIKWNVEPGSAIDTYQEFLSPDSKQLMMVLWCIADMFVNGSCILALSGLIAPNQTEGVLSHFSLASRLARLGDARNSVLEEFGYDLGEKVRELEKPLTHSMLAYGGALERLFSKEPEAMTELMHLDSKHLYGGVLRCEGDAPAEEMDSITQRTNDIEVLLKEANEVQPLLREKIAPQRMWLATVEASVDANLASGSSEQHEQEENACLVARRTLCKERVDGLLALADEALDPGAKKPPRVKEKAMYKYRDQDGAPQFSRVRDIARMALQFETAEALIKALPTIYGAFEVVEVENRFANPTALGWMDVTLLINMELPSGEAHIAELQVQLSEFAAERRRAHTHYKTLREIIPAMGVQAEHVDAVQRLILEAIEGRAPKYSKSSDKNSRTTSKASSSTAAGSQRSTSKNSTSASSSEFVAVMPSHLGALNVEEA